MHTHKNRHNWAKLIHNSKIRAVLEKMFNARTDLAVEAREMYYETGSLSGDIPGIDVENENISEDIHVTRVKIKTAEAAAALGKERGNYITLDIPRHFHGGQEVYEQVCRTMATELEKIIKLNKDDTVLVIGLGNWNITADALGPKVVDNVMITRHLKEYMPHEIDEGIRPVCALSPGVLGLTGIETGEITKGLVEKVGPKAVIAIDALCSRKMERINTTIQISDTGITPGSGIGNKRMGLNEKTLGIPVIAIGVPTVVDAATIASDSIDIILKRMKSETSAKEPLYNILKSLEEDDRYELLKEVLSPVVGDLIVTPKEVDTAIDDISLVIANGINISLHEGIGLDDIDRYK